MRDNWLRILLKKIIEIVASLVVLAALSFLLLKLLPGGPFDEETALNPLVKETLAKRWGLQESALSQLLHYLSSAFHGDLGVSMIHPDRRIIDIITDGLSNTFGLSLVSLAFVIIGAFTITLVSIRYRETWFETLIDQSMIAMLSLPSLFWGPLLIYIFGFYFDILPVAFLTSPIHYILPVLTLSFRPLASLVRLLKTSVNENLHLDYVRTAQAKGVGPWGILINHILRNSLIPFLSYAGFLVTSLLSGSFLVEWLFAIPGLGTQFVNSLGDRDYTLIVGITVFYGALLILVNTLMDILMLLADPRLREEA